MYSEKFSEIYDEYGWEKFPIEFGRWVFKYLNKNSININTHGDFACGTGTLCNFFQSNGFNSVGFDFSSSMLNLAKDKYQNIEFVLHDLCEELKSEGFDLITMSCDSINHILNLDALVKNISSNLNENGYFIFDCMDEHVFNSDMTALISEKNHRIEYDITNLKDAFCHINVKVFNKNDLITEENVTERIYTEECFRNCFKKYNIDIVNIDKKSFKKYNKILYICKKAS